MLSERPQAMLAKTKTRQHEPMDIVRRTFRPVLPSDREALAGAPATHGAGARAGGETVARAGVRGGQDRGSTGEPGAAGRVGPQAFEPMREEWAFLPSEAAHTESATPK